MATYPTSYGTRRRLRQTTHKRIRMEDPAQVVELVIAHGKAAYSGALPTNPDGQALSVASIWIPRLMIATMRKMKLSP